MANENQNLDDIGGGGGGGGFLTASNGLTAVGTDVVWGVTLTANTAIDMDSKKVEFNNNGGFRIGGTTQKALEKISFQDDTLVDGEFIQKALTVEPIDSHLMTNSLSLFLDSGVPTFKYKDALDLISYIPLSGSGNTYKNTFGLPGDVSGSARMNGNYLSWDNGIEITEATTITRIDLGAFTHVAAAPDAITVNIYEVAANQGSDSAFGNGTLLVSQLMKSYSSATGITYGLISTVTLGSPISITPLRKLYVDIVFSTGFATLNTPKVTLYLNS